MDKKKKIDKIINKKYTLPNLKKINDIEKFFNIEEEFMAESCYLNENNEFYDASEYMTTLILSNEDQMVKLSAEYKNNKHFSIGYIYGMMIQFTYCVMKNIIVIESNDEYDKITGWKINDFQNMKNKDALPLIHYLKEKVFNCLEEEEYYALSLYTQNNMESFAPNDEYTFQEQKRYELGKMLGIYIATSMIFNSLNDLKLDTVDADDYEIIEQEDDDFYEDSYSFGTSFYEEYLPQPISKTCQEFQNSYLKSAYNQYIARKKSDNSAMKKVYYNKKSNLN